MNKLLKLLCILALLCVSGCKSNTYQLDPKWAPLECIKQKPRVASSAVANMATTIGSTLYVDNLERFLNKYKPGSVRFNTIMTHERVHAIRETSGIPLIGNALWLIKYVFSADFMWEEERIAAYFGYKQGIRKSAAEEAKVFSERYFTIFGVHMVDYDTALKWVNDARSNRWKPDITKEEYDFYMPPK